MPNVIVISGANGAGKSTLAPHLLPDAFGIVEYVNADTIAQGLSAFAPENAAFEAGRIMLKRLNDLAEAGKDFAFETTLASRFFAGWLKNLQSGGYNVHLIFLYLKNADLAIERVRERVRLGGHNVPENIIRRRFVRGLRNFFEIYQSLADSWAVYDVSTTDPVKAALSDKINGEKIFETDLWKQITNQNLTLRTF